MVPAKIKSHHIFVVANINLSIMYFKTYKPN